MLATHNNMHSVFSSVSSRVVKLASPNINYLLIAGAALMYACVFMYTFMFTNVNEAWKQTILCNVRNRCVVCIFNQK